MHLVFNLIGKCQSARSRCAHLDGNFLKPPCRGCERNPRLVELKDHYMSQTEVLAAADKAVVSLEEASGEKNPDHAREERNDGVLGEFGVKPAELRRAASSERPNVS